jgi:hypothetical protein
MYKDYAVRLQPVVKLELAGLVTRVADLGVAAVASMPR